MKCILNKNIPNCVSEYLKSENVDVIYTNKLGAVSEVIGYHPDIQCAVIKNTLFTSLFHLPYYKNFTDRIIVSEKELNSPYPADVLFNCFVLRNKIFGNEKTLDINLKKFIKENNFEFYNVKQGYTNCSALKVTDNAVITSDKGIAKAFHSLNIDVLMIDNSDIILKGCNKGFIGGAACNFMNKIIFFGEIEKQKDFPKIKEFLGKYNVDYKSFPFPLEDFGSALFLE